MTEILAVRVYGLPVAQPRAGRRAVQVAPGVLRVRSFDPPAAKDWKRTVLLQVLPLKPSGLVLDPLAMKLVFHLPRPVSLPKKVKYPVKKPDASNLLKGVEDALLGVVYRDDSQIVKLEVEKIYSDAPGVEITIRRVE